MAIRERQKSLNPFFLLAPQIGKVKRVCQKKEFFFGAPKDERGLNQEQ
jgi:hypothetical protein